MKKLLFGFDYFTPKDPIPNGLPREYLIQYMLAASHLNYKGSKYTPDPMTFQKIYGATPSVAHGPLFQPLHMSDTDQDDARYDIVKQPVSEIYRKDKYVYPIEVFGGFDFLCGTIPKNHHAESLYSGAAFTKYISKKALNDLRKRRACLLINYMHEGMMFDKDFEGLHRVLNVAGIPTDNIWISISDRNIINQYHEWYIKRIDYCEAIDPAGEDEAWLKTAVQNERPRGEINFILTNYYLDTMSNRFAMMLEKGGSAGGMDRKRISMITEEDFQKMKDEQRPYYYLSYNRRRRPHRIALLSLMLKAKLFDKGLITIGSGNWSSWPGKQLFQVYDICKSEPTAKLLDELKHWSHELWKKAPMTLEDDIIDFDNMSGIGYEYGHIYKQVYFDITNECASREPSIYFSEKTWRPIGMMLPFFNFNAVGSLKALRDLGFKTFHPHIDESYDEIDNVGDRMLAILKEVERLCAMTPEEIHKWYYGMEDILVFNQRHLLKHARKYESHVQVYDTMHDSFFLNKERD